jgi:hypothetical protein
MAAALVLLTVAGSDLSLRSRTGRSAAPAEPGSVGRTGDAAARAREDGVDVAGVMESVSHRMVAGPAGVLVSEEAGYRATFDDQGFVLAPEAADGGLRITTTGVARGLAALDISPAAWRGDANVAERALTPDIAERVTATSGQVEWDVVLAERPAGAGDLRIDARVSGAASAPERTDDGLVWTVGGQRVVMGELVVEDRTGAELYRAMPSVDGADLSLTVPGRVLDDAAYPVVVDPVISPERPVSDPVTAPALGSQGNASVAFDGTNYLVVWTDGRADLGLVTETDVYGARVRRSGEVIDPTGIPIATGVDPQYAADVSYDGANHLVTFNQYGPSGRLGLHGIRLSRAGQVAGAAFPIATGELDVGGSKSSYDGTNHLVVWEQRADLNGPGQIYGARVSGAGVVLDPGGFHIAGSEEERVDAPRAAFDGTNHLVVWTSGTEGAQGIFGVRIGRDGTILDPVGIRISPASHAGSGRSSLAFDGTNHLVVWSASFETSSEVFGARVSRSGAVLDPEGIRISPEVGSQFNPNVAFDGTNHLVAFEDNREGVTQVSGARVGRNGVVRDPTSFPIANAYANVTDIGFDGTNHLVLWSALHQDNDVEAARVTPGGMVRDGVPIKVSTSANAQTTHDVAFDGTNYFVVWEDKRSGTSDIYGARVAPDGRVLDGTGIAISTGHGDQLTPTVAFDGTGFLVVWQDGRYQDINVYAAVVRGDGTVVGPFGIATTDSERPVRPDVAFDGTNYLVVWETGRQWADPLNSTIHGARVRPDGSPLDAFVIASDTYGWLTDPAVAFDGTNFLVVWTAADLIVGARVDPAGQVMDATPLRLSDAGFGSNGSPALAYDGTNYLVVWQERLTANRQQTIFARVSPAGEVLDPYRVALPPDPGNSGEPQVSFNGTFLVVWEDRRPRSTGRIDVYGARVRSDGTLVDAEAFAVASHAHDEIGPAVVAGPGDHWGVVYNRFSDEPSHRSQRVFLREVAPK